MFRIFVYLALLLNCAAAPSHFLRGQHDADENAHLLYNATLIVPLHERSGTMHMILHVGQPSVSKILIVDTGSRLAAWKCFEKGAANAPRSTTLQTISCGSCHYPGAFCNFHDGSCQLTQKYTEGSSWTAVEVEDVVSLTLLDVTNNNKYSNDEDALDQTALLFRFGCQTQLTGLFQQQYAQGILGLERSEYSLVYHMHQQKLLPTNSFSLCFMAGGDDDDKIKGGGLLGLGGAMRNRHLEPMKYTPLVRNKKVNGLYVVQVTEVWIGNTCLACDNDGLVRAFQSGSGTILDSVRNDKERLAELESPRLQATLY
jgi:hypothetical protein